MTIHFIKEKKGDEFSKTCEHCGILVRPVLSAAEKMRVRGWYCSHCNNFDPAVGRESKMKVED